MKKASVIVVGAMLLICGDAAFTSHGNGTASAQGSSQQTAASLVKPETFVSIAPVPRGRDFWAAIVVGIAQGYHMNSHKPSEAYLIPTTVTPDLPNGFQLVDTMYPAGKQVKFAFSPDKPLDVYSGSVTLKLRFTATNDAPLGPASIPVTLRYQACSDSTCLPPVKVPVEVKFEVAAAGTMAKPAHPDVFPLKSAIR